MNKYKCANCGSDKVSIRTWVNPNTGEETGSCSDGESQDNYCDNCETHPELVQERDTVKKIYQLQTAKEFIDRYSTSEITEEQLMQMYARHVATSFAAECANEALGNKMEVSNALHSKIDSKYNSIEW